MSEEKIIGSGLDDGVLLPENEQKRDLLTEVRSEAEGDADVAEDSKVFIRSETD